MALKKDNLLAPIAQIAMPKPTYEDIQKSFKYEVVLEKGRARVSHPRTLTVTVEFNKAIIEKAFAEMKEASQNIGDDKLSKIDLSSFIDAHMAARLYRVQVEHTPGTYATLGSSAPRVFAKSSWFTLS